MSLTVTLDVVRTLATVAVPVVVAVLGYRLGRRLKLWEASQWRNQELIKARLRYFDELSPLLNDLMCYLTFIGRWKELDPPEVLAIKRSADRLFFSVAPLFSEESVVAYRQFADACFEEYAGWGVDARIRSGFVRRREAVPDRWRPEWTDLFTHAEADEIRAEDLTAVRTRHDELLRALAEDIALEQPRNRYGPAGTVTSAR
jgi:hypothetical protein